MPQNNEASDVIGTWRAEYDRFLNPYAVRTRFRTDQRHRDHILRPDGTYTQRFQSPEFNYKHSGNRWELMDQASEGPKLVMLDLVYFAHGLKLIEGPLELFPQRADFARYQQLRSETGIRAEKLTVNYPADGFVYLYPGIALASFSYCR